MTNNWTYTTIQHGPRLELGLSINAYCVLDVIYKSQTHPRYGKDGWATIGVRKLAAFFGLSVGGVHGILAEAEEMGLLEFDPGDRSKKRTTAAFYDKVLEDSPVQKVNAPVQKVNASRSESEHINKEKQKEEDKGKSDDSPKADLPDLFNAVPNLKEDIGPTHYKLLNEACTKGLKAEATYTTLRSLWGDGRFKQLRRWLTYKKETRKGYRAATSLRGLINQFAEYTPKEIEKAVTTAITSGHAGIYPKRIPDAKMKPLFPDYQKKAL